MAHYGELFDGCIDLEKENMYTEFDKYFNHPIMTKIKDVNNHSMYMTKTVCLLSNECRYIIVFILSDKLVVGSKKNLADMRWISLQTRTLPDKHDLPSHGYQHKRDGALKVDITRTCVTPEASTYNCDMFPLIVTLLHKKSDCDYQSSGNIISAIETYSTIITLK